MRALAISIFALALLLALAFKFDSSVLLSLAWSFTLAFVTIAALIHFRPKKPRKYGNRFLEPHELDIKMEFNFVLYMTRLAGGFIYLPNNQLVRAGDAFFGRELREAFRNEPSQLLHERELGNLFKSEDEVPSSEQLKGKHAHNFSLQLAYRAELPADELAKMPEILRKVVVNEKLTRNRKTLKNTIKVLLKNDLKLLVSELESGRLYFVD